MMNMSMPQETPGMVTEFSLASPMAKERQLLIYIITQYVMGMRVGRYTKMVIQELSLIRKEAQEITQLQCCEMMKQKQQSMN